MDGAGPSPALGVALGRRVQKFRLPYGRYVVCAKADDPIARPARARLIWAANTAQATQALGIPATLVGLATDLPFKAEGLAGKHAVRRHLAHLYGAQGEFDLQLLFKDKTHQDFHSYLLGSLYPRNVFPNAGIVHTRDPAIAAACNASKVHYILEDHSEPYQTSYQAVERLGLRGPYCRAIVAITEAVAERLRWNGWPEEKIIVLDSGVAQSAAIRLDAEARSWRSFLLDGIYSRIICYSGGMQLERGIEHIFLAAKALPDFRFVFIGGHEADLAQWHQLCAAERLTNIKILGYLPHGVSCAVQQSADMVVMSRSGRSEITSPLKFFEYLAAGTPIVSAKIPALRRFENTGLDVTWYDAEDPPTLREAIVRRSRTGLPWPSYARANIEASADYTWDKRQRALLDFVGPVEVRNTF
jgi:glycosyltransferase involved in cell wall biosynthesis